MCGRFILTVDIGEILKRFKVETDIRTNPRHNIAPTQNILIITSHEPSKLNIARWGLMPSWAKHPIINTREDSITKPLYKSLNRCLIPADGFFEWKKVGSKKIPYFISLKGKKIFAFAGLCNQEACSIITTAANQLVKPIHDRMPAILEQKEERRWLKGMDKDLLRPYPSDEMQCIQISDLVNSPKNDNPEVIAAQNLLK
ncbi:SOS response-associated peptidase [Candidatus Woesearchaeota archaeon]|nr:SOS response-associated peptidase [Candidatus Woesearchaeota archaeon]